MPGHRRRRATQGSPATPISPRGGGVTASIALSLLLRDAHDIASSLLRELNAVGLATNVMVFLGRDTQPAFLTLDRSEAVEMAVDTRRATEGPANVLSEYVEEAGGTRLRVAATQ